MNTKPNTPVKLRPVDQILDECQDPRKPSSGAIRECLLSLQRQLMILSGNQATLQKQNQTLAGAADRLTNVVFDTSDGAGGTKTGLLSEARGMFEKMLELESRSSNYLLFSTAALQFLSIEFPKLMEAAARKGGGYPTPEQCEKVMDEIIERLRSEGEAAQKAQMQIEAEVQKMVACGFCRNWCSSSLIRIGEDAPAAKCNQDFVQLACGQCMSVFTQPVPPMDVPADAKCPKCDGAIQREISDETGQTRTMCQLFDLDPERARKALYDAGVRKEHVLAVFPEERQIFSTEEGAPSEIGTAESRPVPPA